MADDVILDVSADISGLESGMDKANKSTGGFLSSITSMVNPLTLAAAAITGLGAAAISTWSDFDAGSDSILAITGASGQALDDMSQSLINLRGTSAGLDTDMAAMGEVIGTVSTRTGLTGQALEDMAGQVLNMSRITGQDGVTAVEDLTRVMGAWQIPMDQSSGLMDKMFKAGQTFGIGMDSLTGSLTKFGPTLQEMGFSMDESIAMLGSFEKGGINADVVMAGLKKSVGNFAKENIPLAKGLDDVTKSILGASSQTDALNIAAKAFGSKAAPDMVAAIQSGNFAFGDAVKAIQGADGAIEDVTTRSMDFGDRFQIAMNGAATALIPVGQALMDLADGALSALQAAFTALLPIFQPFVDAWGTFFASLSSGGDLMTSIGGLFTNFGAAFSNAWSIIAPVLGTLIGNIVQWIVDNGPTILSALAGWAQTLWQWVVDAAPGVMSALGTFISGVWEWITANGPTILATMSSWATTLWQWIVDAAPGVWSALTTFIGGIWSWITANGPTILATLTSWGATLWGWIVAAMPVVMTTLGDLISGIWKWITDNAPTIWEKIKEWGTMLWNWIVEVLPIVMDTLGGFISSIVTWIVDNGPTIGNKIVEWAKWLWQWIVDVAPTVMATLGGFIEKIWNWIVENGPTILGKLAEWAGAFIGWILPMIPPLLLELGKIALALLGWVAGIAIDLGTKLVTEWIPAFWNWITGPDGVLAKIGGMLGQIWTSVTTWIGDTAKNILTAVGTIGGNLIQGIKDGISNGWTAFVNWVQGLLGDMLKGILSFFGIQSPSTVMRDQVGKQLVAGMQAGWVSDWPAFASTVNTNIKKLCDEDILAPIKKLCDEDLPAVMTRITDADGVIQKPFKVLADADMLPIIQKLCDEDIKAPITKLCDEDIPGIIPQVIAGLTTVGADIVGALQSGMEAAYGGVMQSWMSFFDELWGEASRRAQEIRDIMNYGTAGNGEAYAGNGGNGNHNGGGGGVAMATGGVVTRPTRALIGEAGPEAVIPLSRFGGMGGTPTLNLYLDGVLTSTQELSQRLGVRARIVEALT